MRWQKAPDLQQEVGRIISALNLFYIDPERIVVFRSFGSRSRARARIWGFPKIWQQALNIKPHYCLEVLSEKFDQLNPKDKQRILIHELLHLPKNFSGALLAHRGRGRAINRREVEKLFRKLKKC